MTNLLNVLLSFEPNEEITEVKHLPSELIPKSPLRKNTIVDVCSKDASDRPFIVKVLMI